MFDVIIMMRQTHFACLLPLPSHGEAIAFVKAVALSELSFVLYPAPGGQIADKSGQFGTVQRYWTKRHA